MDSIDNFYERAVALLASQFQITNPDGSKTNLQKVIASIESQAQIVNDQEYLLNTERFLNLAQGAQLDGIGQIVGLSRFPGQSDDDYREALQFQIFINESSGTPEQLINILKFLTKAQTVWYNELYPAAYQMATDGLIFPSPPNDLINVMQAVSPAGVEFVALAATYAKNPFVFSSDPITEQFYVAPNIADPNQLNPLQVDAGAGALNFYIQRGQTVNPNFGGGFAEAIGSYPNYAIDTTGAGQLAEAIQL